MEGPRNFFSELKRRNVYRAAVAYGVVAWFLTQLTTQVFPFFDIPNSAIRFVVIALALGFPIAMCLSWVYEFTPQGIVRSEDVDPAKARSARRRMREPAFGAFEWRRQFQTGIRQGL